MLHMLALIVLHKSSYSSCTKSHIVADNMRRQVPSSRVDLGVEPFTRRSSPKEDALSYQARTSFVYISVSSMSLPSVRVNSSCCGCEPTACDSCKCSIFHVSVSDGTTSLASP